MEMRSATHRKIDLTLSSAMNKHPSQWPADKIERKSIDALIPYASNSRTHSDEQISQIAASMREWGWTNPVLIDETGMIIAGHGRILAAKKALSGRSIM